MITTARIPIKPVISLKIVAVAAGTMDGRSKPTF
jgi:hypothetical protein